MVSFFPPGFWKTVAMMGMTIFFIFGVDMFLGARMVMFLSKVANRTFNVDKVLMQALSELKRTSEKEFDLDRSLMHGWGRIVMGGLLLFGGAIILMSVLPNLR